MHMICMFRFGLFHLHVCQREIIACASNNFKMKCTETKRKKIYNLTSIIGIVYSYIHHHSWKRQHDWYKPLIFIVDLTLGCLIFEIKYINKL